VPVSGGAGLGDVGIRSRQGGVPEAFLLRVMGPLFMGTLKKASSGGGFSGELTVETTVVDLASARTYELATVGGVEVGDTMVVENLANKTRGCGVISDRGLVRVGVEADGPRLASDATKVACSGKTFGGGCVVGDRLQIHIYDGQVVVGKDCKLKDDAVKKATIKTFAGDEDITYQGWTYEKNRPLVALMEGLGKARATPGLRRFTNFAAFVIEPGDPVAYVRHLLDEPLLYPKADRKTGTHSLIVTTQGDMNVPASSGVTAGRVAGLIDFLNTDPRQGKPQNQVLLDTYTAEAVDTYKRYTNKAGAGVHMDVENFSQGSDIWGSDQPRLPTPLRIGLDRRDALGGMSGAIFPLNRPTGDHGFDMPSQMTDRCLRGCADKTSPDPCGCSKVFDIGRFMFNMMGRYFLSGGKTINAGLCNSRGDCTDLKAAPKIRDKSTLQ
jgi:hypothetical protein